MVWMQIPIWFRFSGSKVVQVIYSNKIPPGLDRCMDYPGVEIISKD